MVDLTNNLTYENRYTNSNMANTTKRKKTTQVHKEKLHKQDSSYQQPYQSKPMNTEFQLGHSRIHDSLNAREEQALAKWFLISLPTIILLAIVVATFLAL